MGLAVALQLPMTWNLNGLPLVNIVKGRWCVLKIPSSVQEDNVIGPYFLSKSSYVLLES